MSLNTVSVINNLTPSSSPSTLINAPATLQSGQFTLRQALSLVRFHLQRLLVPENSWLVTVIATLYLVKKLRDWSRSKQSGPLLPLPIDHQIFPQYIVNKDRLWLYTHQWTISHPKAYIFISPAFSDHSLRYESVARAWNNLGFSVFSLDHQGHGQSGGDPGYVESFDDFVEDFLLFVEHTRANLDPKPCFLLGRGMGATVAIQVMRAYQEIEEERKREVQSRELTPELISRQLAQSSDANIDDRASLWKWHGCILIAPALIPPHSVSPLQEMFSYLMTDIFPKFGFFSVLDANYLSRIPAVVSQYRADPLCYKGPMLARWGTQFLSTMEELKEDSHTLTFPFLVLQGTGDTFVNPRGAEWLMARSQSKDKKLKRYQGAYHDLLNDANRDLVFNDTVHWMELRLD